MLPEYYTHPERFNSYVLETDKGQKITHAKTRKEAIKKVRDKGLKVLSCKKF